jgi:hypothetical protein
LSGVIGALAASPAGSGAQAARGPRFEARVEGIVERHGTVQLGIGFNAASSNYTGWGVVAAVGATERRGRLEPTARADAVIRFLLDPFHESKRGLYGLGGVGVMENGNHDPQPRVFIGLGLEGERWGPFMPAFELALGGGVRLAAVFRRPRPNRR